MPAPPSSIATTPVYIACVLLAVVLSLVTALLPDHVRQHPLAVLVLGVFLVCLCTFVPVRDAFPFAVLLVLVWAFPRPHPAFSVGTHVEVEHVSRAVTGSSHPDELYEGFANVREKVDRAREADARSTAALQKTMAGAKVNAKAISAAMERFHNLHYRRDEYEQKMKSVREGIQSIREMYTNGDGRGEVLQKKMAKALKGG